MSYVPDVPLPLPVPDAVARPCPRCGRVPVPYADDSLRWPDPGGPSGETITRIGPGVHSIHYRTGPVPFVLVREVGQEPEAFAKSLEDDEIAGAALWCGRTLELDCTKRYIPTVGLNLYDETDALYEQSSAAGAGTAVVRGCILLYDMPPGYRAPSAAGMSASGTINVTFDATNNIVLNIPVRGVRFGFLIFEVSAINGSGGAQATLQIRMKPRGAVTSQGASLAALSASGQVRTVAFGEVAGRVTTNLYNDTVDLTLGGYGDRLIVYADGTAGISGSVDVAWALYCDLGPA